MLAKSLQSCLTLCDTMDCSLPGSSVYRILLARILEWVAMPSSRGSSLPRYGIHISYVSCIGRQVLYHLHHLGRPLTYKAVEFENPTCFHSSSLTFPKPWHLWYIFISKLLPFYNKIYLNHAVCNLLSSFSPSA